jgi:DnaJ-class molecular chaperone
MPSSPLPRVDRLAAHQADPGRACFADEAGIDFPALAVAVERMRHAFVGAEAGPSLEVPVDVARRTALTGGDLSVQLPVRRTCDRFGGRGEAWGDAWVRRTCERCGGRGEAWGDACAPCAGAGHTEETRHITIALPRGLADGDRLLVRLGGRPVVPTAVTLHVRLS